MSPGCTARAGIEDQPDRLPGIYSQKLRQILRNIYVIFGIMVVCYGFYNTMSKAKEGNILMSDQVHVLTKYIYPSVTFCYKFKHGSKSAIENYYPYIYEQGKTSGIPITHTHTHT